MRRILWSLAAFLLLFSYGGVVHAQGTTSLTIPEVTGEAGTTVSVPINVTDFNNVGAITLVINYDPSVVTFEGLQNTPRDFTVNASDGQLNIGWFDPTASNPINLGDGTLLEMNFAYAGGSSALAFDGQSEIADIEAQVIDAAFNGGAIVAELGQIDLGSVTGAQVGDTVRVPIVADNISGVGSVSLTINYDAAVLTPTDNPLASDESGLNLQAGSPQAGRVNVGGFSTAGVTLDSTFAEVAFVFSGGSTTLSFGTESAVTDVNADAIPVAFDGSIVTGAAADVGVVRIPDVAAEAGTNVTVPVVIEDLENVGSVSLEIKYNAAVLSFVEAVNVNGEIIQAVNTPQNGELRLGGFSTAGVDLDGAVAELVFNYNGGTSALTFAQASSEITDVDGVPANVRYEAGSVVPSGEGNDFVANLAGYNEVPPVQTTGQGTVTTTLVDGRLSLSGTFDDLQGKLISPAGTPAHLHVAGPASNGPIAVRLAVVADADSMGGSFPLAQNVYDLSALEYPEGMDADSFATAIRNGNVYVNVHTTVSPGGEIRGHLLAAPNAAPEAVAVVSPADGDTLNVVGSETQTIDLEWEASTDPDGNEVVYVWQLAVSEAFDQLLVNMNVGSDTSADLDFGTVNSLLQLAGVEVGDTVTVFHRVNAQDGSERAVGDAAAVTLVRGQVGLMTIADAREQPLETQVTVEGTVTRAMGRFVRLQDETAGITLFEGGGDFPVASQLEGGDLIRVSGELAEFNGLLEILPDTVEVLDDNAGIPDPQVVTAGDLLENCESFESELVQIDLLRFTGSSEAFDEQFGGEIVWEANTSYEVFGSVEDTIVVRTQRETDTQLVGNVLDKNAFSYSGVVGEFRGECQLVPVLDSDVFNERAVANEGGPEVPQEFALHGNYPNPFNPSTTISFDLPAAADVTITLYDVMGREVRSVPMGRLAPGAEQTVKFDGAGLGSGVYVYRVVAVSGDETHASTGKMVLVK